jgi:hypothetical protein
LSPAGAERAGSAPRAFSRPVHRYPPPPRRLTERSSDAALPVVPIGPGHRHLRSVPDRHLHQLRRALNPRPPAAGDQPGPRTLAHGPGAAASQQPNQHPRGRSHRIPASCVLGGLAMVIHYPPARLRLNSGADLAARPQPPADTSTSRLTPQPLQSYDRGPPHRQSASDKVAGRCLAVASNGTGVATSAWWGCWSAVTSTTVVSAAPLSSRNLPMTASGKPSHRQRCCARSTDRSSPWTRCLSAHHPRSQDRLVAA